MEYLLVLAIFGYIMYRVDSDSVKKENSSIQVIRTQISDPPSGWYTCGNCRGTGDDGFGIMPDGAPCEACYGKGRVKPDPNAVSISLEELVKKYGME